LLNVVVWGFYSVEISPAVFVVIFGPARLWSIVGSPPVDVTGVIAQMPGEGRVLVCQASQRFGNE